MTGPDKKTILFAKIQEKKKTQQRKGHFKHEKDIFTL